MKSPLKWHNLSGKIKKGLFCLCFFCQNPSVALLSTKSNMTNSICTISCFLRSSSSETLIFMFLGVRVVTENHVWHTQFVFVTLIFILIYRALGNLLHFKNSNLRPGSNEQSYCSRSLAWTAKRSVFSQNLVFQGAKRRRRQSLTREARTRQIFSRLCSVSLSVFSLAPDLSRFLPRKDTDCFAV